MFRLATMLMYWMILVEFLHMVVVVSDVDPHYYHVQDKDDDGLDDE